VCAVNHRFALSSPALLSAPSKKLARRFAPPASATFALKAGVWFRRGRLLTVSPDSRANLARRQAEIPLIVLCRFPEPALTERRGDTGEVLSALARRAAWAHEPDRIAFYLYDLASEFHAQQNNGNDAPHLRFIIKNDPQMTKTRLALNLLGVGAEMR
jgi:hypothetical protein